MAYILIAAVVFALCFALDKGYTKIFRSKAQHASGKEVRVSKRFGSFGLILVVLGTAGLFMGINGNDTALIVGGAVVILVGIALVVYYMGFGIYYDDDSFLCSGFGRKSVTYEYRQIRAQQLYASGNTTVVELYMTDGTSVTVQSTMTGAYDFLDHAFSRWCAQRGIDPAACGFHDPDNSLWFPMVEG